jgi:hypothetical protein
LHDRALPDPWRLALILGLAFALAVSAVFHPIPVRGAAVGQKVVVIVGPVGGGSIQSNYLSKGEAIADAAEARGATVVRVFSPNATYAAARAAVSGANIIVYIGHGSGYPNPYSGTLQAAWNNGWGLNAIAGVDAYDSTGHGHTIGGSHPSMVYCGEAAIEGKPKPSSVPSAQWCAGGKINPAPNFVMVFSNACYSPGAGETEQTTPSSESLALTRVGYYSRPFLALGGSYFASDLGSKSVVEAILDNPDVSFGDIFAEGNGFSPTALRIFPHPRVSGRQAWIQRTSGPGGLMSYWYAFAGEPTRTPNGGTAPVTDSFQPFVLSVTPKNTATAVPTSTTVTARFSETVSGVNGSSFVLQDLSNGSSVSAAVSVDPATATATLIPSAPLASNRSYRMTATNAIQDGAGNSLNTTTWTFTTGGPDVAPPVVLSVTPKNTSTGASTNTTVTARFSETVQGVSGSSLVLQDLSNGSSVSAAVSIDPATATATLIPSTSLSPNRSYRVTATNAIQDGAGNSLNTTTWTFTTGGPDVAPPVVLSVTPKNTSTGASTNTTVTARFSETVQGVNGSSFVLVDLTSGDTVSTTVSFDAATATATLSPGAPLSPNRTYRMTATNAIQDGAGNPLNATSWTFTTGF